MVDFIAATNPMTNVLRGYFDRGCFCSVLDLRPSKYDAVDHRISSHVSLDDGRSGFLYPFPKGFLELSTSKTRSIILINFTVPSELNVCAAKRTFILCFWNWI